MQQMLILPGFSLGGCVAQAGCHPIETMRTES